MEKENTIMGFVEVNGKISKVTSVNELEKLLSILKKDESAVIDNQPLKLKLRSIGMETFIAFYPFFKCNIDIKTPLFKKLFPHKDENNPDYQGKKWEKASWETKVDDTRSIIRDGLEIEALKIIKESVKTDESIRILAEKYLCG